MHGYEMIKEIEERTQGAWTPSAGSIYPTLQLLEDEGLIRGEESEGKRRFTLTEAGAGEQREKAGEETPWDAVRAGAAPEQIRLKDSLGKLNHAIGQVFHAADEDQQKKGPRAAQRDPSQDLRGPRRGGLKHPRGAPPERASRPGRTRRRVARSPFPSTDPHI